MNTICPINFLAKSEVLISFFVKSSYNFLSDFSLSLRISSKFFLSLRYNSLYLSKNSSVTVSTLNISSISFNEGVIFFSINSKNLDLHV